jgi:hypothetical protein
MITAGNARILQNFLRDRPCGNNPPQTFQEYQLNHDIADPMIENDDSWQSTKTRKATKDEKIRQISTLVCDYPR